ncbi:hypothetical protein SHIRM173S_01766 [Streptomyces hirsutus]
MSRFCCGVTRPNTVPSSSASAIPSGSAGSRRASTVLPSRPSLAATAPTDTALSPEMTLARTSCSAKYRRVSAASGRNRCSSTTSAVGRACPGDLGIVEVPGGPRQQQHPEPLLVEALGLPQGRVVRGQQHVRRPAATNWTRRRPR